VHRPDGNAMSFCQVDNRWQLIACPQAASDDLFAQSGGDYLVWSARRAWRGYWHGHDARHRCRCSAVCFVDPSRVHLEGRGAPTSVAKASGDRTYVDAGGDELGRRIMAQRMQACAAQPELYRQPAVAVAQRAWPVR
jgi:hypothetical protein